MEETIYISKRCKHCHELLVLLHKYRDVLKFNVVDVDNNSYPRSIDSVPCIVIDNKILGGIELFKFIEYLINENVNKGVNENVNKNDESNNSNESVKNAPSNDNTLPNGGAPSCNTLPNEGAPNGNSLDGYCFGDNSCLLFSSFDDNSYSMSNYEELQSNEISKSCSLEPPVQDNKTNKSKELDDDFARMQQERANDMR